MYYDYNKRFRKEKILVTAKTIHSSKGLEAKAVFIIGLVKGSGGFPNVRQADRIFQVIKESNIALLLEEERRLFYVGITRAEDELYLITEKGNESEFLKEIPKEIKIKEDSLLIANNIEVRLCSGCNMQVDNQYSFCPNCGRSQQ